MSGTGIGFVGLLKTALKKKNISTIYSSNFSLYHSSTKPICKILEIQTCHELDHLGSKFYSSLRT